MNKDRPRHPAGLPYLFLTEMWERFSFYLMVGILFLYLTDSKKGGLGWTDAEAAVLTGTYMALVYLTPFIGGLIADRLLGYRKTILIGASLMMIGHIVLAIPAVATLYVGLGFLILGNGAFKPNISSLLGNLYPPGSPLKDAGYNIFYLGINVGAFACNFVAAFVRNYFDAHPWQVTPGWTIAGWHAAFGTAGIGMFLGLVIFGLNYRRFREADQRRTTGAGPQQSLRPLWLECLVPAAALGALAWWVAWEGWLPLEPTTAAFIAACIPVVLFYFNIYRRLPLRGERSRVAALLVIFVVSIVFWMIYGLNISALNIWARDDTDRAPAPVLKPLVDKVEFFAEKAPPSYFNNSSQPPPSQGQELKIVNTEVFQSINPGFIIILTPLLVGFWNLLRRRRREPSTTGKIDLGILLLAGGPLVMLFATLASMDGHHKVSAWWLVGTYGIVTVAELCLSPMGLSLVNKISPPKLQAFMMGGWFLSTSIGQKLSGLVGEAYTEWNHYFFWSSLIVCCLVFAGLLFLLLPWLHRQMGDENNPEGQAQAAGEKKDLSEVERI